MKTLAGRLGQLELRIGGLGAKRAPDLAEYARFANTLDPDQPRGVDDPLTQGIQTPALRERWEQACAALPRNVEWPYASLQEYLDMDLNLRIRAALTDAERWVASWTEQYRGSGRLIENYDPEWAAKAPAGYYFDPDAARRQIDAEHFCNCPAGWQAGFDCDPDDNRPGLWPAVCRSCGKLRRKFVARYNPAEV